MKDIKFSLGNFAKQNTPDVLHKIGDFCLVASALGIAILAIPETLAASGITGFVLPQFIMLIGKGLAGVGIVGKTIIKCFGETEVTAK